MDITVGNQYVDKKGNIIVAVATVLDVFACTIGGKTVALYDKKGNIESSKGYDIVSEYSEDANIYWDRIPESVESIMVDVDGRIMVDDSTPLYGNETDDAWVFPNHAMFLETTWTRI